ncbi:hypothetical protein [Paenibacillus oceani]|uniref:Uncharacterized protein n=1 Tax=Paenibacillus oceani TaxID=2772510 RepID=A0A927H1J4_9BACL|nr:hypothetical protein [Paenibacillus oceani]MBD2864830.1 hypothetical protein [Paenibacillus oceani]
MVRMDLRKAKRGPGVVNEITIRAAKRLRRRLKRLRTVLVQGSLLRNAASRTLLPARMYGCITAAGRPSGMLKFSRAAGKSRSHRSERPLD